jgi:hypothetical protein
VRNWPGNGESGTDADKLRNNIVELAGESGQDSVHIACRLGSNVFEIDALGVESVGNANSKPGAADVNAQADRQRPVIRRPVFQWLKERESVHLLNEVIGEAENFRPSERGRSAILGSLLSLCVSASRCVE